MRNNTGKTEIQAQAAELVKKFHEYWKQNGEPHPSSNDYLALNRTFFYYEGITRGIKIAMDKESEE